MLRTEVTIDHIRFFLAQGGDPAALREEIVQAVRSGGDFVRFTEVGNRSVSVLISPGVGVIFEEQEVGEDAEDNGDLAAPFQPTYDATRGYVEWDIELPQ